MWIPQEMLWRIRGGSDFLKGDWTLVRAAPHRLHLVTGIYTGCRELWSLQGGEGGERSRIFLICSHFLSTFCGDLDLDLEGKKVRYPGARKMAQLLRGFRTSVGHNQM